MNRWSCLALLALAFTLPALAAGRGEPGPVFPVEILLQDRAADLALMTQLDIDVDGVFFDRARAYVIEKEVEKLQALGFMVERIPDDAHAQFLKERDRVSSMPAAPGSMPTTYHTYETLTSELQALATAHPNLLRLSSIGQSVQGRELWMMKISDNPGLSEDEPAARFIGGIHGDEVVGKELLINMIHYLVDNYGTDARVTALVDNTEIWFLPSMNPDGTALGQRYNASGADLNRSFPDQFTDPVDSPAGRPIEVQNVMNWDYAHSVNVAGIFHGGTLVANYPYDGNSAGTDVYSAAPDDVQLVSLARTYADHNPSMFASNSDASFWNGICNGADWYTVRGGLQDYGYVWRGTWDMTLELGTKWPDGSTLPSYWNDNFESMMTYLERVQDGVRGVATDSVTGAPLKTTVKISGNSQPIYGDPDVGDYHRLLLPGSYSIEVSAAGHVTEWLKDVLVPTSGAVRRDVRLEPTTTDLQESSYRILDGASGNGFLDPGETTDMAVVLKNLGSYASNPTGTLIPIGWYATVPRATATYPAIAVGASAQCQPPYYSVVLSPQAPAGTKVGFVVRWTASSRTATSEPFWVPAGARSCTTVSSTAAAIPVPDRATKTSTLAYTSATEIDEVNVYVDITHPYRSDLVVTVVSPSGTPVALHDHTGGSASNILGWYDSQIAPQEPLSRFIGEAAQGTWTLKVTDTIPANTGTLNTWKLEVCGRPLETRPPEMMLRAIARAGAGVALDWWAYPGLLSYNVYRGTDPRSASSFTKVASPTGTHFDDATPGGSFFYLVTGVSARGEGPRGAYGM